MTQSKIILALDFSDRKQLEALVERLEPSQCRLKVGKELFTRFGPTIVELLTKREFEVFLDLKYHDIPNTVAQACAAAADMGVWMVNVHAQGGRRMLAAAREVLDKQTSPPLLIAVTILTSMQAEDVQEVGLRWRPAEAVDQLAAISKAEGLDGVVCSALEAERLRQQCGPEFCLVTPGIRLAQDDKGDQRRVMTPVNAVRAGAHYLVVGRSITQALDPLATLKQINAEIAAI